MVKKIIYQLEQKPNHPARYFELVLTCLVFFSGYKGWGCTDDTDATSEIDLLAATLLLCLSNLLFLPAVGLAIYRGFYTESFVYFSNMVFSTVRFKDSGSRFPTLVLDYLSFKLSNFK